MRHLYIIGNGFDLAHGLETSYHHFLMWYLNKRWDYINENQQKSINDDDNLIRLQRTKFGISITIEGEIRSVQDFKDNVQKIGDESGNPVNITYSSLLKEILDRDEKEGWADIESTYYNLMVGIATGNTSILNQSKKSSIEVLNNSMNTLKKELEFYLTSQVLPKIQYVQVKDEIKKIFSWIFHDYEEDERPCILNFNYTGTFESVYLEGLHHINIVNIHGVAGLYPIIFGYGDEMDVHFKDLENTNDNQFLKNLKSFGYLQSDDYKKILVFLSFDNDFKVHLIGHSLGLSDRLLLNTIFEHKNCKKIEIHYSNEMNDFDRLIINLSRHFNLEMKGAMRQKVVPLIGAIPMDKEPLYGEGSSNSKYL